MTTPFPRALLGFLAALAPAAALATVSPAAPPERAADALAHDIYKELVEIDTTDNVTPAAQAMAQRFRAAGFAAADVTLAGPNERKQNLVVRLHGTGKERPVLLIGHLDVVAARREDWSTDPFKLVEQGGFFYGRGTLDMKGPDAIMVTTLIRLKQEGFQPSRDIILALTADEESGAFNGVDWLVKNRRALIDAQLVLSGDEFSVVTEHGVPQFFRLVASEKLYADYQLSVTGPGGHSSQPGPDNPIYSLSRALERLAEYRFPFELNNVTRAYLERMTGIESGQRQADIRAVLREPPDAQALQRFDADPIDRSVVRTTCVATRLSGGHANNALPQRAEAVVNCRILPGHSAEEVRQQLVRILADPKVAVRYIETDGKIVEHAPAAGGFAPASLPPQLLEPLTQVVGQMWPGIKVIPFMSAGASDATYTSAAGLPTFTFAGLAVDRDDDREHGRDERLGVTSFYRGNEFFYRLMKAFAHG
jgi:acetylornithine deacetylase/succinyl-diaminopimelate desuccinylase-like protein